MENAPQPRPRKSPVLVIALAAAGLLVITCVGGTVALLPAITKARGEARQAVVLGNQRAVLMILIVHAMDNGERLPEANQWVPIVAKQTGDPTGRVFDSPRIDGNAVDFAYAPPRLADGTIAPLRDIDNPSAWVLIYEDPERLPAQYDALAAGFLDGHVQVVTRGQLAQMLKAQEVPIVPRSSRTVPDAAAIGPK